MDRMQQYEINDIIDCIPNADRNMWEAARYICYVTAQVNSKKKLKPADILKMPWEIEVKETPKTDISKEDIKRLEQKSKRICKMMKNIKTD